MIPADKVAALTAIRDAVDRELAAARRETLETALATRVRSFAGQWGPVNVVTPKPAAVLDDRGLLAWCKANHPEQVQESVRPAFQQVLKGRCRIVGDAVVDSATAEVLDFARVLKAAPYVSWPKSDDQAEAKRLAQEWVTGRVAELTDLIMRPAVEATNQREDDSA